MSRSQRRAMIDREEPKLSLVRQCALLGISRSSLYYLPTEAGAEDMELTALIDQLRWYPKTRQLSLSQKPDTPRVVDFWMSALAGITLFSVVFPTLSLHRTLESVCPPSVNPVKGLCETGSTG